MTKPKPHKFNKGDIIIKNFYHSHGKILGTVSKSDAMGSYVGYYDKPGETTYTVEYVQLQDYGKFSHYCYKLKEAGHMFIHDTELVDIEFDLYSDWLRGIKMKKILDEIQGRKRNNTQ